MDESLQRTLLTAAGAGGGIDGDVVTPASVDALADVVRTLGAASARFRISSGTDAQGSGVTVSLARLTGLSAYSPRLESLTLRAEAGVALTALRDMAGGAKLAVVGLPPSVRSRHVGALIARGEVPRRALCGIEAVLPSGDRVRFGGGVLKDVVGYDLPALMLGSLGRLAVIAAVTFRLEPESARTPVGAPPGVSDSGLSLLLPAFDPQGLLQAGG